MHWMLMPLRRYADFTGRSRRTEYWMFVLFQLLVYGALFVLFFGLLGTAFTMNNQSGAAAGIIGFIGLMLVGFVIWLALLVPSLAVTVRRLHDTNRSGWWFGGYLLANFGFNIVSGAMLTTLGQSASSPEQMMMAMGGLVGLFGIAMFVYAITLLVFFCLDGTPGPNRYGPDPKGRADAGNIFA